MPIGLLGLMIAAIFAAAMSASAGELNALATATIIDFYRRHFVTEATDAHYLRVSKFATIAWGLFASIVAMYAAKAAGRRTYRFFEPLMDARAKARLTMEQDLRQSMGRWRLRHPLSAAA